MHTTALPAYAWKSQLLSSSSEKGSKKFGGLLKDNFEEATFLYDLYKTSTVTEVSHFKQELDDTQKGIIGNALRVLVASS